MGDRYTFFGRKCEKCGDEWEEVYYAPTSGFLTHTCPKCKQVYEIVQGFELIPITKEQEEQVYKDAGFSDELE